MNRLATLVSHLDEKDLVALKKDVEAGNLQNILKKRLREVRSQKVSSCPVCGARVKEGKGLLLHFGSPNLRKKAVFDGADCLHYFLDRIK
ncbi:MAG: hypothetical protein ACQESC_02245 [Nanobdellota archaeon]